MRLYKYTDNRLFYFVIEIDPLYHRYSFNFGFFPSEEHYAGRLGLAFGVYRYFGGPIRGGIRWWLYPPSFSFEWRRR